MRDHYALKPRRLVSPKDLCSCAWNVRDILSGDHQLPDLCGEPAVFVAPRSLDARAFVNLTATRAGIEGSLTPAC